MSRQIRISIDDDEVFERLKRRKDALDLSWEDALRRGLRDSPEAPRPPRPPTEAREGADRRGPGPERRGASKERRSEHAGGRGSGHREREDLSPFDPDFGQRIAQQVLSSVGDAVPGVEEVTLEREIDRLEDAEDAVLVLGEGEARRVPLRVALHTGPDGLDVEVVAVRSGKGTEGMNRFDDGARADVARRFAQGETATLELDAGDETYDVRPDLEWARGPDGTPTVTDVTVREVVFED